MLVSEQLLDFGFQFIHQPSVYATSLGPIKLQLNGVQLLFESSLFRLSLQEVLFKFGVLVLFFLDASQVVFIILLHLVFVVNNLLKRLSKAFILPLQLLFVLNLVLVEGFKVATSRNHCLGRHTLLLEIHIWLSALSNLFISQIHRGGTKMLVSDNASLKSVLLLVHILELAGRELAQ